MFHWFRFGVVGRDIKEIHIPAVARCVFVYATNQEIQGMQKEYTILPPQTITALHQNQ